MPNLTLIILTKKSETTNMLAIVVREHLNNNDQNHTKILLMIPFSNIDDSIFDLLDSGAGFIIPDLKVQKSFYLSFSIFTLEWYVILMTLNYIYAIFS